MNSVSRRDILKHLFAIGGASFAPKLLASESNLIAFGSKDWGTLQASQLNSLVGNLFSAHGEEASCDVVLKAVHVSNIDPGRPKKLARTQAYTATFAPFESYECFQDDQILELTHPDITGNGQLYVSMKRNKQGESYMEVTFN